MVLVRIWFRRLSLLIIGYELLRLLFWALNAHALAAVPTEDKVLSLIIGLRFDLAAIATLNGPLVLIHSLRMLRIPQAFRNGLDHLISALFIIANIPLLVIGIGDAQVFSFTGRRTTPDFFGIGGDLQRQASALILQYWYLTVFGLILCGLIVFITWQKDHRQDVLLKQHLKRYAFATFFFLASAFLAVRGGIQSKPLVPAHAYVHQPAIYANLILNSSITMLRTPPSDTPKQFKDFPDLESMRAALIPSKTDMHTQIPLARGKNVVVLIVESLASEYVGFLNNGKGYTPFIDSLMAKSVTFKESFANGRRSIDAMPAIFASIPAWRDQPFVTSPFNGNAIQALPEILKGQGYESYFFHGGANGSMHFDAFSAMAGFKHYIGENEYPHHEDFDGAWGIFDEPFLEFAAETLDKEKKPFIAGIFTLSSHNPFPVPEKYKFRFPKGTLPIHESIGYADFAISQFIAKASTMKWFYNTIFVITGDHTSLSDQHSYENVLGRHRVPIFIFDPSGTLPQVGKNKIIQHVDIAPTILDLLGETQDPPQLFGWSAFDPDFKGRFIQEEYGEWLYYDDSVFLRMSENSDRAKVYSPQDVAWEKELVTLPSNTEEKIQTLKAARQYYTNGLINNDWLRPK